MNILGINHWFHDSSACLVVDGRLVVALEEERFSREKHTRAFPHAAIERCLDVAGLEPADVDLVADSIRPTHRAGAKSLYALAAAHRSAPFLRHEALGGVMKRRRLRRWLHGTWPDASRRPVVHAIEHHAAHAAGSFFVCPWEHAAILSLDGSGEWASACAGEIVAKAARPTKKTG